MNFRPGWTNDEFPVYLQPLFLPGQTMPTKTLDIQVQDDHLERIASTRKPILAIAELIWNSLDADATKVAVSLSRNPMDDGVATVEVTDDGHSIPYLDAEELFTKLGGSWKQKKRRTHEKGRLLHGKEGRGRFRAFALGRVVDWNLCYRLNGDLRTYSVAMIKDQMRKVSITDENPAPQGAYRGSVVRISEVHKSFQSLLGQEALEELNLIFALYLRQYPDVEINYSGQKVDPGGIQDASKVFRLSNVQSKEDGREFEVALEIVEWKVETPRKLYYCSAEGFPLDETVPGVQAPGFQFTAYLKSEYFSKLLENNTLDLSALDPTIEQLLVQAKETMRAYFRERAAEKAAGLVEEWKDADIYPYKGMPQNPVEEVERQVFNVVALNVNSYLPEFDIAPERTKRFQMRLLRQAIERSPADLALILEEVLGLPEEKRQELAQLLERTTLSAIISASKVVADRLEFLRGLKTLVFDPAIKHEVRERTQLHRVIADNTWMFGEQYHLSVDDESLTEVLKKHLELQSREVEIDVPVLRQDGKRGIVDLMLSKNVAKLGDEEREHLVVELKRPDVAIDADVATQIEKYAFAVASALILRLI
jgi:hypothetical protein